MPDDIPKIPRFRGKRNRPIDSDWRQQQLPAYRPIFTTRKALPFTTILGLVFLGIGIVLKFAVDNSLEFVIKYTNCTTFTGKSTSQITNFSYPDGAVQCHLSFHINDSYTGKVKFYYGLKEFYQNNKLYVESRNDVQLLGNLDEVSGCKPLDRVANLTYAPCGFVANSMFNDSFKLFLHYEHTVVVVVPFTTREMIADQVKRRKFRNPKRTGNQTLCDAFQNTLRPPWWQTDICKLGVGRPGVGIGFENVDFMIWMQTSALPNFRKHYRNLDTQVDGFRDGLPNGVYTLVINYNYPATWKGAEKSFIITRESWIGPRREFLVFSYIACGVFLLSVSVVFLLIFIRQQFLEKTSQQR